MTQAFTVELLQGLPEAGPPLAVLREPTGADQAMLSDLDRDATPAEAVSALIAALALQIGDCAGPDLAAIRRLTAGDRERLLLAIAGRLLGPTVDLVAPCPICSAIADVPIPLADAIAARPDAARTVVGLAAADGTWTARCRAPTGTDLERAARGGATAERELMVGCLVELADPAGNPRQPEELPAECGVAAGEALAALDPAAECRMALACPSCAGRIDALLDGLTIVRAGLGGARLYGEVYRMARAYHWSEADILALPLSRRRRYLAIAEAAEAQA